MTSIVSIRRITQAAFLLLFLWLCAVMSLGTNWWQLRGWPVNIFLQLDPLAALSTLLSTGTLYRELFWAAGTVVLTILLGRFFCGWVCPFGTLHQYVGWLHRFGKPLAEKTRLNGYRPATSNARWFMMLSTENPGPPHAEFNQRFGAIFAARREDVKNPEDKAGRNGNRDGLALLSQHAENIEKINLVGVALHAALDRIDVVRRMRHGPAVSTTLLIGGHIHCLTAFPSLPRGSPCIRALNEEHNPDWSRLQPRLRCDTRLFPRRGRQLPQHRRQDQQPRHQYRRTP